MTDDDTILSGTDDDEQEKGIGIPGEFNPFHEQNLPKKGEPSTILRFLRLFALWILAFTMISSFAYSIMLSIIGAKLVSNPPPELEDFRNVLSYVLSFMSLGGFLLLGIASEGKDRAAEIQRIIDQKKKRMQDFGLTEEQARLVEEEFIPVKKKGTKTKKFFFTLAVVCISCYTVLYFSTGVMYHLIATYGLVGAVVSIGFILAGFAGEINVEIWRLIVFRIHVHEAAIGIFFIIVAVPMLYFGSSVDKILAVFYFFTGAFLMGRDWKDISAGKIVERLPRNE